MTHPSPHASLQPIAGRHEPTRRTIWFALLAPPIAWAMHGGGGLYLTHLACRGDAAGGARIALAILTVVALVVCALSLFLAVTALRGTDRGGNTRPAFLTVAAVVAAVVFGVGVLWGGLPLLVLSDVCEGER